jgi:molecular chaperone Hsp31 and glyoxalase 3
MIKKLMGLNPQETEDGAFSPSPLALKLATSSQTDYDHTKYSKKAEGGKNKILMVCTEERNLTMANGKQFSTGNHPVEMLVPMLHFKKAGFDIDVCTPTGKSAKIEMWAFPKKDRAVQEIFEEFKSQFDHPKNLKTFVESQMEQSTAYIAVFIPGGHGAMIGLPESRELKELIQWSSRKNLMMLSICHGPAALLAASIEESSDKFIYKGYKMAVFPDAVDKQTPLIGYMPGHLTWEFGKKLKSLGVKIVNRKADKTCFHDRNLITGASPKAANEFGKLATSVLLERTKK